MGTFIAASVGASAMPVALMSVEILKRLHTGFDFLIV